MATAGVLVACPSPALDRAAAQTIAQTYRFDIPAQPLASALAQFATIGGVDIAYRQSLAAERSSSAIRGNYTAPVAVQMLLRGTGLAARFTDARAVIIYDAVVVDAGGQRREISEGRALKLNMAEVRAPLMVGARDQSAHRRYAVAVQSEISELLRTDGSYQGRPSRLEIGIAVGGDGEIRKVTIHRPSAEPGWDRRVVRALAGHVLSTPPPNDLSGSLSFEVVSSTLADRLAAVEKQR